MCSVGLSKLLRSGYCEDRLLSYESLGQLQFPGSFETIVSSCRQVLETLPDRCTGQNSCDGMEDAGLCAFSVFFTQNASFPTCQRMMAEGKGSSSSKAYSGRIRFRMITIPRFTRFDVPCVYV
jgi:hypothetical protein